jgi:hypothetical protein
MPEVLKSSVVVGQMIWWVSTRGRVSPELGEWVSVEKVGRIWITLSNGLRINRENLVVEPSNSGYSCSGKAYLTLEAHQEVILRDHAWSSLRNFVDRHYSTPAIPTADILEAYRLLGGKEAV